MAMGLEVSDLGIDLSQTAGIGGNEFVDLGLVRPAAIADHGRCFCAEVLFSGARDALGFEGLTRDAFGHSGFAESTIAADLPHFADFLDFLRAESAVVEFADFLFREIAVVVHGAGGHENMSVNIAMIAFRVRLVQTHAKARPVGIAKLKAETAQQIPLSRRIQLMG